MISSSSPRQNCIATPLEENNLAKDSKGGVVNGSFFNQAFPDRSPPRINITTEIVEKREEEIPSCLALDCVVLRRGSLVGEGLWRNNGLLFSPSVSRLSETEKTEEDPTLSSSIMALFKKKCRNLPRPSYENQERIEEEYIVALTEKLAEEKLVDLLVEEDDRLASFHCILALSSFPANQCIENIAQSLKLNRPDILNLETLGPWIPRYRTDSGFWEIGSVFIAYQKMDLAKAWIQKGKETGVSASILESLEVEMIRIQAEKTVSGVIHAIEGCFPKHPERAVRIFEAVQKNPKIQKSSIWRSVLKDLAAIVYAQSGRRLNNSISSFDQTSRRVSFGPLNLNLSQVAQNEDDCSHPRVEAGSYVKNLEESRNKN